MRIITQLSTLDRWRRPSARAWSHLGRVLRCEALWKRSGSAKVGGRRRARAHGVAKLTGGHFAPRRDVLRRARSRGARIAADGAAHPHRDAGGRAEQGTNEIGRGAAMAMPRDLSHARSRARGLPGASAVGRRAAGPPGYMPSRGDGPRQVAQTEPRASSTRVSHTRDFSSRPSLDNAVARARTGCAECARGPPSVRQASGHRKRRRVLCSRASLFAKRRSHASRVTALRDHLTTVHGWCATSDEAAPDTFDVGDGVETAYGKVRVSKHSSPSSRVCADTSSSRAQRASQPTKGRGTGAENCRAFGCRGAAVRHIIRSGGARGYLLLLRDASVGSRANLTNPRAGQVSELSAANDAEGGAYDDEVLKHRPRAQQNLV